MTSELPKTADAVVVGGGTVGAWCAYFLRRAELENVVLVEKGTLGQGASSRAAGVVRVQGGTPEAVRLGRWTRDFYLGQRAEIGTDSGFVQQGYLLPCFTAPEVEAAQARIEMQRAQGLGVRGRTSGEGAAITPTRAPGCALGATYCDEDGYITPPRNVAAYTAALVSSGVLVAERTRFCGLDPAAAARGPARHRRSVPGAPQGGGGRGAPGLRRHADGGRRAVGAVLAAGGGRPAVRDERSRRAAGREPPPGPGLPRADAVQAGGAGPGHGQARPAPGVGGDDRLHARSPADYRPRRRSRP